jgi:3-phosphoshikimate 1-carboxyvinyltransferase
MALRPADILIGGDPSSAAFIIVASLIVPGSNVRTENVIVNPTRAGLFDVLRQMGANIMVHSTRPVSGELLATIESSASALHAVDVPADMAPRMIDEYPIAAIAAAFAHGTSIFRGIGELRHKESDRLERLASGLRTCGVDARISGDDLIVQGCSSPMGNVMIDSHGDHRIAMAFAVFGLAARHGVAVEGADMIATSFPSFVQTMRQLGAAIEPGQ